MGLFGDPNKPLRILTLIIYSPDLLLGRLPGGITVSMNCVPKMQLEARKILLL